MDVYLINPLNRAFVEGQSASIARPPASLIGRIGVGVLVVLAALLIQFTFQITNVPLQLWLNGATTTATYLNTGYRPRELYMYGVEYRYYVDGVAYTQEALVDIYTYLEADTMSPFSVIYARHNPQMVLSARHAKLTLPLIILGCTSSFTLFVISLLARRYNRHYRRFRLERQGRLVDGEIARVEVQDTDQRVHWHIVYMFTPPDVPNPIIDTFIYTPRHPYPRHPQIGDKLAIAYLDSKNYQPL